MPSIKRTGVKAQEVKTGFEAYDGPAPTARGMFRGKIKSAKVIKAKETGRDGLQIVVEAEAVKADPKNHKQYDGYPMFGRLWFGDEDALVQRENNFYAAIGAGDDPNIVYDEKDGKVSKIGKVNPVGKIVTVDLRPGTGDYADRMDVDGIYKSKDVGFKDEAVDAPDEDVEDDEEIEEDGEFEEREEELNGTGLPDLRKIAKELDIKTTGLKKDALVEAILDAEFPEDGAAALDEDEEPEEDEEEEDEDEVEEEEDDEEEEDEEDDGSEERRAELAGLNRVQLKKILKDEDHSPEYRVLKSTTEEDMINAILDSEFGDETPF